MSSYQYRDPHVKDKRLIFNMGIPIPGKSGLYIETGPWCRGGHLIRAASKRRLGSGSGRSGVPLTCWRPEIDADKDDIAGHECQASTRKWNSETRVFMRLAEMYPLHFPFIARHVMRIFRDLIPQPELQTIFYQYVFSVIINQLQTPGYMVTAHRRNMLYNRKLFRNWWVILMRYKNSWLCSF